MMVGSGAKSLEVELGVVVRLDTHRKGEQIETLSLLEIEAAGAFSPDRLKCG